jgi:hypothetical protein
MDVEALFVHMSTRFDQLCKERRILVVEEDRDWFHCQKRQCKATYKDDVVFFVSAWGALFCATCFDGDDHALTFDCDWELYYHAAPGPSTATEHRAQSEALVIRVYARL